MTKFYLTRYCFATTKPRFGVLYSLFIIDQQFLLLQCAEIHGVNWVPIQNCSSSIEGAQLLVQHGDATHNLRPKMTIVPHVLLNGRHIKSDEALTNFKHILCSDYGDPRPEACIDII